MPPNLDEISLEQDFVDNQTGQRTYDPSRRSILFRYNDLSKLDFRTLRYVAEFCCINSDEEAHYLALKHGDLLVDMNKMKEQYKRESINGYHCSDPRFDQLRQSGRLSDGTNREELQRFALTCNITVHTEKDGKISNAAEVVDLLSQAKAKTTLLRPIVVDVLGIAKGKLAGDVRARLGPLLKTLRPRKQCEAVTKDVRFDFIRNEVAKETGEDPLVGVEMDQKRATRLLELMRERRRLPTAEQNRLAAVPSNSARASLPSSHAPSQEHSEASPSALPSTSPEPVRQPKQRQSTTQSTSHQSQNSAQPNIHIPAKRPASTEPNPHPSKPSVDQPESESSQPKVKRKKTAAKSISSQASTSLSIDQQPASASSSGSARHTAPVPAPPAQAVPINPANSCTVRLAKGLKFKTKADLVKAFSSAIPSGQAWEWDVNSASNYAINMWCSASGQGRKQCKVVVRATIDSEDAWTVINFNSDHTKHEEGEAATTTLDVSVPVSSLASASRATASEPSSAASPAQPFVPNDAQEALSTYLQQCLKPELAQKAAILFASQNMAVGDMNEEFAAYLESDACDMGSLSAPESFMVKSKLVKMLVGGSKKKKRKAGKEG